MDISVEDLNQVWNQSAEQEIPLKMAMPFFEFNTMMSVKDPQKLQFYEKPKQQKGDTMNNNIFSKNVQIRHSDTGIFRWILQNLKEHLFYRTPTGDCL